MTQKHPNNSVAEEWAETGSSDKIVVPWTVTQNFPAQIIPVLREAMSMLEEDVGCVEFPEVSRESLENATWNNGIVFVYENELSTMVGCYSMVGVVNG